MKLRNKTNSVSRNKIINENNSVICNAENSSVNTTKKSKNKMNESCILSSIENTIKVKNKRVHFTSVASENEFSNTTQRRRRRKISDYFDEPADNIENSVLNSSSKSQTDKKCNVTAESSSDIRSDLPKSQLQSSSTIHESVHYPVFSHHVPIYKQPILMGNTNYKLTPPKFQNKTALYEFEVDENEQPNCTKKKRNIKKKNVSRSYKRVKKLQTIKEKSGIDAITASKVNHNTSTNIEQLQPITRNIVSKNDINMTPITCNVTSTNDINMASIAPNIILTSTNDIMTPIKSNVTSTNGIIMTPIKSYITSTKDINMTPIARNITSTNDINMTPITCNISSTNVINMTPITSNITLINDSLPTNSPLPEHSTPTNRVNYNMSMEYNNRSMTSIMASTPFRSPFHSNNTNVRLSGGEVDENKYSSYINVDVYHDSDKEDGDDDCFGFRVNCDLDDSMVMNNTNTSLYKNVTNKGNLIKEIEEPKISVAEVISLLKKDVENVHQADFDMGKKKAKHAPITTFYKPKVYSSPNDSPDSDNSQLAEDNRDTSNFTKPPRRSYVRTRKLRRHNYDETEHEHDGDACSTTSHTSHGDATDNEGEKKKKPRKKQPSKKEVEEMERLAAAMNAQFLNVDNFSLCVE